MIELKKINTQCRQCMHTGMELLYDFGMMPLAHGYLSSPEQADKLIHSLCVHYCPKCSFVQITNFISPDDLYKHYNFCFSSWQDRPQVDDVAKMLYEVASQGFSLEIASNDGLFLEKLVHSGFIKENIIGIEPNPYACAIAREKGFSIVNEMFDSTFANTFEKKCDLIVARHVFEHIIDMHGFLSSCFNLLTNNGYIYIEVPDFECALLKGDGSAIWEEHPNYFTTTTLCNIIKKHGFFPEKILHFDVSGGTLGVLASKSAMRECDISNLPQQTRGDFIKFKAQLNYYKKLLTTKLKASKEQGKKIAIYGAGYRTSFILNAFKVGQYVDYVIDDQTQKQGLYIAGTKTPIVSPDIIRKSDKDWVFLLLVYAESEANVIKKISDIVRSKFITVSLCVPNDICAELEKIS